MSINKKRVVAVFAAGLAAALAVSGCSRVQRTSAAETAKDSGPAKELRLGYFPNVTHAPALIGMDKGFFAKNLGTTKISPAQFNAGPNEVSALLGGSLDAAFIGSGPAINAYSKSGGDAVRLVAGATAKGAQLVVKPNIKSPADLQGKTIATPQLANTQDVAAKKWLAKQKLTGKTTVTNLDNPSTLDSFKKGDIDGAWLPEPWSSRLIIEGGAKPLVDETSQWPGGSFPTTVLVVRTEFLHSHPETVKQLLRGELQSITWAQHNPAAAKKSVNTQLAKLTGKALKAPVLDRAWQDISVTPDPNAKLFPTLAGDQVTAGVASSPPEVAGMADLTQLNAVLAEQKRPAVSAAGLDKK